MAVETKRLLGTIGLLLTLAFFLGVTSNELRTQPLPLFEKMPELFSGEISVDEAYRKWRSHEVLLWDARSPESFRKAHLPDALSSEEEPARGKMVVVYCSSRLCPKASEKAEELRVRGYKEVWVMPDGIQGWNAAGYPLKGSPE